MRLKSKLFSMMGIGQAGNSDGCEKCSRTVSSTLAVPFLVRPAWTITKGCKSRTHLDCGNCWLKTRVSIVRWNLKEVGGKISV